MLLLETLRNAAGELWSNKFRSVLTTLGIVIATGSVIAVVSLLDGMTRYMHGFIEELGTDAIWIAPDLADKVAPGDVRLTAEDGKALAAQCGAIARVAPLLQRQESVRLGAGEAAIAVVGTTQEFPDIRNWYVERGRYFSPTDQERRAPVCVVGQSVAGALESKSELLHQKLRLGDHSFDVIGVLEKKGNLLGQDQDKTILIPYETAIKLYGQAAGDRVLLLAQAASSEATGVAVLEIERVLRRRHDLATGEANDFTIQTQDQALDFFEKSSRVATFVLAGVVGISLVVGGIGIMNIMLVSVTERTREIGILKALGARDKDILVQFLAEAVALSTLGGVLGIALGALASQLVTRFSPLPPASVPLWAAALGFAFSTGVGVFFGMYPAVKAARLQPIEALRHE